MTHLLTTLRDKAHHSHVATLCLTRSMTVGHLAYFGAVSMEGHGTYALMAGVMAVLTVVSVTLGVEEH
jgi:hypothetical protein